MTTEQLSQMMAHGDPRVREHALRHAQELLARGEEKPRHPHYEATGFRNYRGMHEFPQLDLSDSRLWHVTSFEDGAAVAEEMGTGRLACAVEVAKNTWYAF